MSLTLTRRYNVDRFGYLIPHRYGNLPMVGVVATFRPGEGRFGRGAVAVEEENNGSLFYPADFFNQSSFTVAGWMKFHDPSDSVIGTSYRRIFEVGDSSSTGRYIGVRRRSATMVTFVIPTGNNDSQHYVHCNFRPREDGWIHFAFTRDGVNVRAIINGDVTEDTINDIAEINPQKLALGCRLTSGLQMDGLIDELLILPYAASEEEILSWYESQGPLPPHPQALLQWDWQAVTHRHNADRFGYLIPTKYGNVPMAGAVATYRPGEGRFGRGAVAVEEGTTNLCDPAYRYTNTWTTIGYGWSRRTIIDCTAGDVFTISADIRNLSQGEDRRWAQVAFHDSGGKELKYHNAMGSGMSEQRLSFTTPPAPAGTVAARVYWVSKNNEVSYQGKNFQIEKKPFATSFVDGSRGNGVLSYNINAPPQCTISFWFKLDNQTRGWTGDSTPLRLYFSDGDGYICWRRRGGTSYSDSFNFTLEESGGGELHTTRSSTSGVWNHICYVFDGTNVTFYYNGVHSGTATMTKPASFGDLRLSNDAGSYLFDELLILPYAASEEEIASWYEAQGPLPPHPQAALQWDWQAVRPAQMVKL